MKNEFLLDPGIAYLNHGSFGACPRVVFEAYQRYQRELEREPVDYLQRHFRAKMVGARGSLAGFLGCGADDLAFVRNATYGMNLVARSLQVGAGDTILTTDHEYGAVDRMWRAFARETGAELVRVPLVLPATSPDAILEAFRSRIDPSVRVFAFPHIAAVPSVVLPVEGLVQLAKETGVTSVVDGAHAPGQVPLDLGSLGADFYVGNCHKWLLTPKGVGFVYAAAHQAERVRPPVVSWGNISEGTSALLLENEWQGTTDISAVLAVSDAIEFLEEHRWFEKVVPQCACLLEGASAALLEVTGEPSLYGSPGMHPPQMASFRLPPGAHSSLHADLYHQHKVELPVFSDSHGEFFRVSVQAYNSEEDLGRLVDALRALL
ncbi:MAG: aminotransferase class V-fold PLP-dependent enzyme [Roseibacillus sp.]|nr:aminotransferase class V-fold PLP-dependent enzyme [Roseibacillus sp.]